MWKITLYSNILILTLFWLLSMVVITPAYNHLVQYAETQMALPIITDYAIQVRYLIGIIPLSWAILTMFYGKWLSKQADSKLGQCLVAHTSVTLVIGLAMLVTFSLAAILPILKIGETLI
jgi:uncharacterized membrane protein (Fun14 family)